MEWVIAIVLLFIFFMWCFCKVSGECSKKEEQYRNLDPKELDNEQKWDEDIYDENFIKKEDANEKRDNLGK